MGYLSYRNSMLARNAFFQKPIDEVNQNVNTFSQNQDQQQNIADSSWFQHPIAKATQDVKGFFGLGDVLPDVQNAPQAYQDLRSEQLKQNSGKGPLERVSAIGSKIGEAYTNELNANKDLNPIQRFERSQKMGIEQTGKVLKGAEQFLSGFVDVGKDIYQGSVYAGQSGEQVNKVNSLMSQMTAEMDGEKDPQKLKQLNETLKQETQKLNDIPVPEMMNQTNAQLIAKAGLASFNTMLTAVTFGTGNILAKGGEKIGGNFLEKIIGSTLEKAPLELGADATFKQIVTSDLTRLAKNKIFNGVAKVIGNKATAESVAIGGSYTVADAVKNGETDPKKLQEAAIKGMEFGWVLDRGMNVLIKGGSKLLGLDTQRNALQNLIAETEKMTGRPLTEAETAIAIQSLKKRVTPSGVAEYMNKSDLEKKSPEGFIETPKISTTEVPISKLNSIEGDKELAMADAKAGKTSQTNLPPLVRKEADGSMTVLDGNGRILQAQAEGKTTIPITTDEATYRKLTEEPAQPQGITPLQEGGKTYYHSSKGNISEFKDTGEAIYFTTDKNFGANYRGAEKKNIAAKLDLKKTATLDNKTLTKLLKDSYFADQSRYPTVQSVVDDFNMSDNDLRRYVFDELKAKGYDSAIIKNDWNGGMGEMESMAVFDHKKINVLSQPQGITPKVETAVETKQPEIIGGTKVAKLAKDVNATAIEKHLTENGFDELAGYNPKVIKRESEAISKLMSSDMDTAVKMATGETPVEGVHGQMLFNAVENAFKDDPEIMLKLAKSPIATERSLAAQTLGLSRVGNVGGPASKIKEVMDTREKNIAKKVGDIKQATKKITKEIESEVKKIPHSKRTWEQFVESIRCK